MEDLVRAWLDCRRNKRNTDSARAFEDNVEHNLCRLRERLLDGSYTPGRSICFVVTHPKAREVWAARFEDRIVHHLLYNRIAPRFERAFVANTAACIKGRGTQYAAQRLEHDVRSVTANWQRPAFFLKCDLANFFVAIDKRILREQLNAKVHEPYWRWLTDVVLMHDPRSDYELRGDRNMIARVPPHKQLLNAPTDTGLPIGNLSSQFFANVHLDALDQHAKHHMHARYYGRYVDDFYILDADPKALWAAHQDIAAFLPARLHCRLNPRKTVLQPVDRGIDFVGQVIKPWRRITRPRTVDRAIERLRTLDSADVFTTGNSYLGLVGQASHPHRERALIAKVLLKRGHVAQGDFSKIYRKRTMQHADGVSASPGETFLSKPPMTPGKDDQK